MLKGRVRRHTRTSTHMSCISERVKMWRSGDRASIVIAILFYARVITRLAIILPRRRQKKWVEIEVLRIMYFY
jgi:hypothetical protein